MGGSGMAMTSVIGDESSLLTVRHVSLRGSQREIGRALAAAVHREHGDAVRPRPCDPALERVRRRWFEIHHPALHERSLGVGDHFGVQPGDCAVGLDQLGTVRRPPACSATVYPPSSTADGHALLARNMDFPTGTMSEFLGSAPRAGERAMVADPWIVELHPDGGRSSISIGFGDPLGGMDGINDAGLAVALLADDVRPALEPCPVPQVGLSEGQVVRYVLETCTSAAEARDALRLAKHHYQLIPCHYVVADATGDSFVWEHSLHRNRELIIETADAVGRRLVCTNHRLHEWPDATDATDDDAVGSASITFHRWRTLRDAVSRRRLSARTDVRDDLASVRFTAPAVGTRTIWSSVFDMRERSVELQFFLGDEGDTSRYSDPLVIALASGEDRLRRAAPVSARPSR
jgi:predicted choloylglycine hydrolase